MELHSVNMVDVHEKTHLLRKSYLDRIDVNTAVSVEKGELLSFMKIKGLSNFWNAGEEIDFDAIMGDVLSGLHSLQNTFVFILLGTPTEISVYLGVNKSSNDVLSSSLHASYPFIKTKTLTMDGMSNLLLTIGHTGGVITGIPTNKIRGEVSSLQIEKLCKGMYGDYWGYVYIAKPMSPFQVTLSHERLLDEIETYHKFVKRSETGGKLGKESWESTNLSLERYVDHLKAMEQKFDHARTVGMWRTTGYYLANNSVSAAKLRNLVHSIYNGEESDPEKIRTIPLHNVLDCILNFSLPTNELAESQSSQHPIGKWTVPANGQLKTIHCYKYLFQSIITTNELATFCQLPRKEMPGYYIDQYVEFEIADRRRVRDNGFFIGKVLNGSEELVPYEQLSKHEIPYQMDVADLNRHGLIVGITGGGKSNTSKGLLSHLWNTHRIPFMVIESAKREYWELFNMKGHDDVVIFTLGAEDEHSIPYRINPFEKMEGIPLQTHIDYVLSTFKASFELFPPMPHVLETSIYRIYEDRGWDVLSNTNKFRNDSYPTLDDLYYKIDVVVDELGYDSRLKADITAALKARVHSLRVGGKGAMLNTDRSVPIASLLSRPVVMELEDIGDDDVKAFLMGIILVQLYEYRRTKLSRNKKFEHLILIEEAHRLLANVSGGKEGNPRAKSVEFFTNLLAEIRSYGQGFLIADQVPSKLAPDILKNTNLKIVHRIVMKEDRDLIGQSMNMNQEQIDYISSLKRGIAAVYAEGDTRPKLVQMPFVKEDGDTPRDKVVQIIKQKVQTEFKNYDKTYNFGPACAFCIDKCNQREKMAAVDHFLTSRRWKKQMLEDVQQNHFDPKWLSEVFDYLDQKGLPIKLGFAGEICTLNLFLEKADINESYKREVVIQYMNQMYKRDDS